MTIPLVGSIFKLLMYADIPYTALCQATRWYCRAPPTTPVKWKLNIISINFNIGVNSWNYFLPVPHFGFRYLRSVEMS